MTSRERVRRAVKFQGPDRIPYQLPDPWGGDIRWIGFDKDPDWQPAEPGMDEWGSVWKSIDASMGQVKRPAIQEWSDLKRIRWPQFVTPERTKSAREAMKQDDGKFVLGGLPTYLWERMNRMRGIENALADLVAYPDESAQLLDVIAAENLKLIDFFGEIGADGIIACDDWGLQNRLMINPATWRRLFKARYARLFERAHQHGLLVFMHSCGYIVDILDDFIEVGLDVIELDQQEHMGLDLLSERFGGRLAFWCPVDIQQTMVYGSIEDVRNFARRLMWQFGRFNGGYIGFWYGSPEAVNHDMAKVEAMAEVFVREGTYPLTPPRCERARTSP